MHTASSYLPVHVVRPALSSRRISKMFRDLPSGISILSPRNQNSRLHTQTDYCSDHCGQAHLLKGKTTLPRSFSIQKSSSQNISYIYIHLNEWSDEQWLLFSFESSSFLSLHTIYIYLYIYIPPNDCELFSNIKITWSFQWEDFIKYLSTTKLFSAQLYLVLSDRKLFFHLLLRWRKKFIFFCWKVSRGFLKKNWVQFWHLKKLIWLIKKMVKN